MTDTETCVRRIVREHLGDYDERRTPNAKLTEDLGADSLDIVELVMAIEDELGIRIPDDDAEKITTVEEAVAVADVFLAKPVARDA